jgi:hypothetical protein
MIHVIRLYLADGSNVVGKMWRMETDWLLLEAVALN